MNLSELNEEERVALVGLVLQLVRADGVTTDDELEELRALGVEMGPRAFDEAYLKARDELVSRESALDYARRHVKRRSTQEAIHTVICDMAAADGVSDEERALIGFVRAMWEIHTIDR